MTADSAGISTVVSARLLPSRTIGDVFNDGSVSEVRLLVDEVEAARGLERVEIEL